MLKNKKKEDFAMDLEFNTPHLNGGYLDKKGSLLRGRPIVTITLLYICLILLFRPLIDVPQNEPSYQPKQRGTLVNLREKLTS